jgi:hypothetical protein
MKGKWQRKKVLEGEKVTKWIVFLVFVVGFILVPTGDQAVSSGEADVICVGKI